MKIYIAGPITGHRFYKIKFKIAEIILKLRGFAVMNPAWINAGNQFTWEEYMDITREMQNVCDAICLLSGWKSSTGARIEEERAMVNEQLIFYRLRDVQ